MMRAMQSDAASSYESGRIDTLLILRGIAALSVVVWHAGGYLQPYPDWINIPGRTAVWIFFGISGYVIAYGFIHGRYGLTITDLKDFYINRILRIYPIFLLLTVLGFATELIKTGASPFLLSDVPAQVFAMQFDQHYALNGVFWTLGIEIHFYLLAPIFAIVLLNKRVTCYLWVSLFLYLALLAWGRYAFLRLGWSFDGRNIVSCMVHFLTGMIACRMVKGLDGSSLRFWGSLSAAVALILLSNLLYHRAPEHFWSPVGIVLIDVVIVCFVVAHVSCTLRMGAVVQVLTVLGTLSYGLYAWHGYWMRTVPSLVQHAVILACISLVSAYLTYRLVEIPALGFKRRRVSDSTSSI
jgi:peptidoglycan/LPS O-acetylase OafA/YrhL